MNWPILTDDLQKLSKVTPIDDMAGEEGTPPNSFKSEYPILFEYLGAVFGSTISNSCLYEQIHGMIRHRLMQQLERCRPITREYIRLESIMA